MKLIAILSLCALASCVPKPPSPPASYRAQQHVPASPPAQPVVDALRQAAAAADRSTAINAASSDSLAAQSTALRAGIVATLSESDRLRKQKTANEAELNNLWSLLTAETQRANELFAAAEKHRENMATEMQLRHALQTHIDSMQTAITNITTENQAIRLQLADAEAGSQSSHAAAEGLAAAAAKSQSAADTARGKITVWRNIALASSGLLALIITILILKPRFL